MAEEAGRGLVLGAALKPSTANTEERGDVRRTRRAVRTNTSEIEHAVAQGTVLVLPEVGDLHLWGHGQP